jgi:hypothetical protein
LRASSSTRIVTLYWALTAMGSPIESDSLCVPVVEGLADASATRSFLARG